MYELSLEVWKFTEHPPCVEGLQVSRSDSRRERFGHRNVAEGFGRNNPPEFVRFLDIARASAEETRALLKKGHATRY